MATATTRVACARGAAEEASPHEARTNLIGIPRPELEAMFVERGMKKFRARQVFGWMYQKGATDFRDMTSIAKTAREELAQDYVIHYGDLLDASTGDEGTSKMLVQHNDGVRTECVYIPHEHIGMHDDDAETARLQRGTMCLSSQAGCSMACSFCYTGRQKMLRNLTSAEIVGQFMTGRRCTGDLPVPNTGTRAVTNVVMMGEGEPLYNWRQVRRALHVLNDGDGCAIGKHRITVSTCGVVPLMHRIATETDVNLAVSLHAVDDALRDELVPVNKQFPLRELLHACRTFPSAGPHRRICFEYVMLRGVNDSVAEARELAHLLADIHAVVNLIPFNPWPNSPYETSSKPAILRFAAELESRGLEAPVRWPRGRRIHAACGMLSGTQPGPDAGAHAQP